MPGQNFYSIIQSAAERIQIQSGQHVLFLETFDYQLGYKLIDQYPDTSFTFLSRDMTSTRYLQNKFLNNPNVKINQYALLNFARRQIDPADVVIFLPDAHTGLNYIDEAMKQGLAWLKEDGQFYLISAKNAGARRHRKMLKQNANQPVHLVTSRNGYRVIVTRRTNQPEEPAPLSLLHSVSISVLKQELTMYTAPSLFSRNQLDEGTKFLITELDHLEWNGADSILDVGSGWGAIGIIAALQNPSTRVVMIDNDQFAVEVSRENIRIHHLQDRVEALTHDSAHLIDTRFDLVVSNPPFHVSDEELTALFDSIKRRMISGGQMYSVIEKSYAKKFLRILETVFGNVETPIENERYQIFVCQYR